MGKKDQGDGVDKNCCKQLEKLGEQWREPVSDSSEKLALADLRLLLEHFVPLQELIRRIAVTSPGETSGTETEPADSAETLTSTQAEQQQALDQCGALVRDPTHCTATMQQLLQSNEELKRIRTQLEARLQQLQEELGDCQAEHSRNTRVPAELILLRSDAELAQQMGLAELPSDSMTAMIQVVAVLAQRDSLDRLWNVLRERCEALRRPVTQAEHALLKNALTWYNHNWDTRPYRFIEAVPGKVYDYTQHLRSRHSSSGETLSALHLPGIADGSGKPLCKALVTTH